MKNLLNILVITFASTTIIFAQTAFLNDSTVCANWITTDSIWTNSYRIINSYNANGNLITELSQRWYGIVWTNDDQITFIYDSTGNQTGELHQTWNAGSWVNNEQYTYTYDTAGNRISSIYVLSGETITQHIYAYDANGNKISELKQGRNGATWESNLLYTYTYNPDGNMVNWFVWYPGFGTSWDTTYKLTYTYDANGNQTSYLNQQREGAGWKNIGMITYINDANGNMINEHSHSWDSIAWVNSHQINYAYDANENLTGEIIQIWNGTWVNASQKIYSYDFNGNKTMHMRLSWNGTNWDNNSFCDYFSSPIPSGNCSATFSLLADTIPHNYYAVNMTSGLAPLSYLWSWGDNTYDSIPYPSHTYDTAGLYTICLTITDSTGCRDIYCHSFSLLRTTNTMIQVNVFPGGSVGINDNHKEETSIVISPNPAFDHLRVSLPQPVSTVELKIFNLIGELTSSSRVNGQKTYFDISNLASGIYILEINTSGKIYRQKFVKGYD